MGLPDPLPVTVGEEQVGWACPKCKVLFCFYNFGGYPKEGSDQLLEMARTHCDRRCTECDADISDVKGWTICMKCRSVREDKKELARFEKAEKLDWETYDGPVCVGGDEYYVDIGTFFDEHDDLCPDYLWACNKVHLSFNAESIVEEALTNHHEDAGEGIGDEAIKQLQAMLDLWADNQEVVSWESDDKRALPLKCACEKCGIRLTIHEVQDKTKFCEDCA